MLAARMASLAPSPSQSLIGRVREMRRQGAELIDFGQQGETPLVARQAAAAMMNTPAGSFYTDTRGLRDLRRTIADKLAAENGVEVDPETGIVVTVGAKEAILATLLALVGAGDEVILEDPGYLGFEPLVRIAGATPVRLALSAADAFALPLDRLAAAITPRTKLIILCTPHNPTGRVRTREELAAVGAIAERHGLTIVVDEAYEHFVYDGRAHVSLAALPGLFERTVTIQTVSKIYNMAGWRIGWAAGPAPLMEAINTVHSHMVTCPAASAQAGAEAAIRAGIGEGNRPFREIVAAYRRQRDAMVAGLRAIDGVHCPPPEGTFFAFPDISAFGIPSREMAELLLVRAGVVTLPGSAFGAAGEGHLRIVFKSPVETVEAGVARIAAALDYPATHRALP